ncbi:FimV/HubP family polar landmark protein [Halomonas faecis]|uniref:FimV/HubP family polar landmark protein n=1 Tax=Halomonas faecis TaxID=1562110 RepID=UPI0013D63C56|nr:FimV/HubP family polar landmark protein [Halomonas faecis]
MSRKLTFASLLSLSFVSPSAWALGVGGVDVHSSLNAPLRASVPLTDVADLDPRQLKVSLAEPSAFERAGLERTPLVSSVAMAVRQRDGQWVVELESDGPVREPWLDLLLRFDWPEGRQLREVTLLLDPPNYAELPVLAGSSSRSSTGGAEAGESATSRSAASSTASEALPERDDTWVGSGDTLWSVAGRLRPDDAISMDQMMVALIEANPEVFPSGNINSMRAGHSLSVPPRDAILSRTAEQADRVVAAMNQAWARRGGGDPQRVALRPSSQDLAGNSEDVVEPAGAAATEPEASALSDAAVAAAESVPAPRLTLLSDEELAAEAQVRTEAGEEADGAPSADRAALDPAVVADLATPNLALMGETERQAARWQESRQVLESQRDALQAELDAMREELDVLRGQLAAVMAERAAEVAEPGQGGASLPTDEGVDDTHWWGAVYPQEANRQLWIGVAGIVALLGLWLLMRWRRRDDHAASGGGFVTMPTVSPAGTSSEAAAMPGLAAEAVGAATSDEPSVRPAMPQAEAINEADIFMAYGRYDQARELLEAGIDRDSGRQDLRFKLLTACVEQGDWASAQREAEWLRDNAEPSLIAEVERLMARPHSVADPAPADEPAAPFDPTDDAGHEAPASSQEEMGDTPRYDPSSTLEPVSSDAESSGEAPAARHETDPDLQPVTERETAEGSEGEAEPQSGSWSETAADPGAEPELGSPTASGADLPDLPELSSHVIDYQPPALDSEPAAREETPMQPSVDFTPRESADESGVSVEDAQPFSLGDAPPSLAVTSASGEDWEVEEVAFPPLDDDNGRPFSAALADDSLDEARRLIEAGESERARALLQRLLVESDTDELRDAARSLIEHHRL